MDDWPICEGRKEMNSLCEVLRGIWRRESEVFLEYLGTYAADWSICWIPVGNLPYYLLPIYLMTLSECDFVFVRLEIEPMS